MDFVATNKHDYGVDGWVFGDMARSLTIVWIGHSLLRIS